MLDLQKQGDVFVLAMQHGENRFSTPFFEEFERVLREVESSKGAAALVTVGQGKFYSNGIDLDWLAKESVDLTAFIVAMHRFLARVLAFSIPTVAALNGHAFAGGALLALTHDFRVMRTDRGYFCLPEVDIGIAFTETLTELVRHKLSPRVAHSAMITGHRYTAEQASAAGIVDELAPEEAVLSKAIALAQSLANKDRHVLGTIKKNAAKTVLTLLEG